MQRVIIIVAVIAISWFGAFGIAFGVSEWREQEEDPWAASPAAVELEALQQQSQAEACRSAVSWWNALKDRGGEPAFTAFKGMTLVCAELSGIDEP